MANNPFPTIGWTTQGRDYNFYQESAVTWSTFGQFTSNDGYSSPDMIITFSTQGLIFTNFTAPNTSNSAVEYSFNGQTLHGALDPAHNTTQLIFDNRVISTIWFRLRSGSSGPITVSVQAWGIR
jgi:hypothetical protein